MIDTSHLTAEKVDLFKAEDASQSLTRRSPSRKRSLNMIPLSRSVLEETFTDDDEFERQLDFASMLMNKIPFQQSEADRGKATTDSSLIFINLSQSTEALVDAIFMEFACMAHSRDGGGERKVLGEMLMIKRNFMAMCLILDIIDSRYYHIMLIWE